MAEQQDLSSLKVSQLKELAQANGVSLDGAVEKSEIVDRLLQAGVDPYAAATPPPGANPPPPPGGPPPPGSEGGGAGGGGGGNDPRSAFGGEEEQAKKMSEGLERIDINYEMNKVFPRPSNVVSGAVLGTATIAGGAAAAAGTLVALPISMTIENGVGGFFMGLGAGILTTIVVVPTTLFLGASQYVMGVINTPGTTYEVLTGNYWDDVEERWVPHEPYSLPAEAARIAESSLEDGIENPLQSEPREVKETSYYDMLGVDPGASQSQLKKAYYKESRKVHPDKNLGDETAKERFQELARVFQILSNPSTRARYDTHGADHFDSDKNKTMEASMFFTMMFGSEVMVPYVGQLQMAQFASLFDNDCKITSKDFKKLQRNREVTLAKKLVDRLQRYVDGEEDGWKADMETEARELVEAPYGEELVHHVGWVYSNYSERYNPSFGIGCGISCMHNTSLKWDLAGQVCNTLDVVNQQHKIKPEASDEEKQSSFTATMDAFLETVAQMTIIDVEETVGAACDRVLKDTSVGPEVLAKREEALGVLGGIFENTHSLCPDEEINWTHRAAEAASAATR